MFKHLLNRIGQPPAPPPSTEQSFVWKGHIFYTFQNLESIPAKRYLAFVNIFDETDMKVSHSDLDAMIDLAEKAFNEQRWADLGGLIAHLKAYRDLYTNNKNMFRLANCFILIDDEPVKDFSDPHTALKAKLYESDDEVKAFFLKHTLGILKYGMGLSTDLEVGDYLRGEVVKRTEAAFMTSIGKNGLTEQSNN